MSNSKYKTHLIHDRLRQLLEFQNDEELNQARLALNEDESWQFDRVFEIARIVDSRLATTPSTTTSLSSLENIASLLQQVFTELSNFRANKNPGHLTNASNYAENIIPQLSGFVDTSKILATEGLEKIIDDLRTRAHAATKILVQEKDQLASQVGNLKKTVGEQERKIEELTSAVEAQRKEAVAVTAEVRAAYSKTDTELRSEFNGSLSLMQNGYEDFEEITKKAAADTLLKLEKNEMEARRIVQVVGNIGVTGNYQKNAATEADIANTMRWLTIGFFAAGVVIAVVVLIAHLFPDISPVKIASGGPWELALRLLTALAIATPAFYTAKESARHRTNSDRAKQRELELASLSPFIELLPKDKKEEIVEKLTDRYFGKDIEPHTVKPTLELKDALDLAKQAIDGLVKVAK